MVKQGLTGSSWCWFRGIESLYIVLAWKGGLDNIIENLLINVETFMLEKDSQRWQGSRNFQKSGCPTGKSH